MASQIAGDSGTRDSPDLGGDLLDYDHQRKTEDKGPGKAIAELGADLAVGADAAGIVVGAPVISPGTNRAKNPGEASMVSKSAVGSTSATGSDT